MAEAHRIPARISMERVWRSRARVLAAMVLGACATHDAEVAGWHRAPPLTQARSAHAVISSGRDIVALAGTGRGGKPVLEVERFDGVGWTLETRLPGDGLNAPAAAAVGNRVFVIGGFDTTTNVPSARVLIYDLDTRRWSEGAPLPRPRGGHAAAVLDGRIHVIGGGNSESTLADHAVYDPATDRWTSAAPLPRSMGSPAAVVHDGVLFSIGGRSGASDFGDVWIYDAPEDRWRAGPPIGPRGTAGAVSMCGSIIVFGGESQATHSTLGDVLRLDLQRGEWIALPRLPTPRNFARAVLFEGDAWVLGGSREAGSSHASEGSDVVERFHARCVP